jgi:hypothetical protein
MLQSSNFHQLYKIYLRIACRKVFVKFMLVTKSANESLEKADFENSSFHGKS